MRLNLIYPCLLLLVSACSPTDSVSNSSTGDSENNSGSDGQDLSAVSVWLQAVENSARSDEDLSRDAGRKPAEVMEFFEIQPGMRVLDLFSGGGYYTELMSYVVGDNGTIVAHGNKAYANYVADEIRARYDYDRLPNVDSLMAENNELELDGDDFDAITMILTYHDVYFVDPNIGWSKIDGPELLAELFDALRPGGVLGVVDHYAEAGSPRATGNTLHRIDPQLVISEIESAGFVLEGKSDVLRNPADDHSVNMSDPSIRGKTDRFVLRFRKPL